MLAIIIYYLLYIDNKDKAVRQQKITTVFIGKEKTIS